MKKTLSAKQNKRSRTGVIALGIDKDTLRLNVLIIDLLILALIGLAVLAT
jgi:hypothetical protein